MQVRYDVAAESLALVPISTDQHSRALTCIVFQEQGTVGRLRDSLHVTVVARGRSWLLPLCRTGMTSSDVPSLYCPELAHKLPPVVVSTEHVNSRLASSHEGRYSLRHHGLHCIAADTRHAAFIETVPCSQGTPTPCFDQMSYTSTPVS